MLSIRTSGQTAGLVLLNLGIVMLAAACGGSSQVQCETKAEVFHVCHGDTLYQCPVGQGEWVDMVKVKNCADQGLVCVPGGLADANCLDPNAAAGHIVGDDAFTYAEADEAGNGAKAGAEETGYTLDEKGIRISGAFEVSATTTDYFRFQTGNFGRIDVQAFVGDQKQDEQGSAVTLSLDAFPDDGYSTLNGNGYFIRAWIQPGFTYVLSIQTSSAGGQAYTLEAKGEQ